MTGFFGTLGGLSHQLNEVWESQGSWFVEGTVTYTRKDVSMTFHMSCFLSIGPA